MYTEKLYTRAISQVLCPCRTAFLTAGIRLPSYCFVATEGHVRGQSNVTGGPLSWYDDQSIISCELRCHVYSPNEGSR